MAVTTKTGSHRFSLTKVHLATRGVHKLLRGLRPSDYQDANIGSSGSEPQRVEAPRPPCGPLGYGPLLLLHPQIKRILSLTYNYGAGDGRVASLDQDVLDALILVKVPPLQVLASDLFVEAKLFVLLSQKFGPDVREGKRRQFNYIGKMLREVEPDLMDALIQATKDSDESKLQALSGPETLSIDDNEEQEEAEETDYEEEEEGSHIDVATRWFDGLINKDVQITNEVYSISNVEFDRQELRKLVRQVHSGLETKSIQRRMGERKMQQEIIPTSLNINAKELKFIGYTGMVQTDLTRTVDCSEEPDGLK
ncbi:hypothetical protein Prudu_003188 [Prunus dulcis]|uniref:Uncharacterized protein n=1 Tax=Prunus dulcis TaxID=3755 RepID=A0A4Y1QSG8_PRUDU|nr:hypothetical protein Prudu_003188 [Prunus dulcis]